MTALSPDAIQKLKEKRHEALARTLKARRIRRPQPEDEAAIEADIKAVLSASTPSQSYEEFCGMFTSDVANEALKARVQVAAAKQTRQLIDECKKQGVAQPVATAASSDEIEEEEILDTEPAFDLDNAPIVKLDTYLPDSDDEELQDNHQDKKVNEDKSSRPEIAVQFTAVEPFELEAGFDYDAVPFTPKFTCEDDQQQGNGP